MNVSPGLRLAAESNSPQYGVFQRLADCHRASGDLALQCRLDSSAHGKAEVVVTDWWDKTQHWLWDRDIETLSGREKIAVTVARLFYTLVRDMADGQITLRAMSLVYTTLLSMAPLLALAFSLLKGFGVHNAVEPLLQNLLAPLGDQATQITDQVIGFVENIQVGVLGAVGLGLLIYTVISLIQKVEAGCNFIWQVQRPRSMGRRFSEYLSVLIVGPLVILAGASLTASATSNSLVQQITAIEPFGTTLYWLSRLVPYFLYSAGFTFLFMFMPNTRVRPLPALAGGLFAGICWQTASFAFANFASKAGNLNAIYTSFAILIFLLIWLYVIWLIMLLGCRVAFLLQNPNYMSRGPYPPRLGALGEERLALLIMTLIGNNFMNKLPPWKLDRLSRYLHAEPEHVYSLVERLVKTGILVETAQDDPVVLPRRDLGGLAVTEVLLAIRKGESNAFEKEREDRPHREVRQLMDELSEAREQALGDVSIRDLVRGRDADSDQAPGPA